MSLINWFYTVPLRLRSLFLRNKVENELDEELQYHLDMQIEENITKGMNRDEARRSALLLLGGLEQKKEECRDSRGIRALHELLQDISYAFRKLAHNPVFTIVAVSMLALGIGAGTGVISIIDALIFRPLPFERIDQLVSLTQGSNFVNYQDLAKADRTFSGVAAAMVLPLELETGLPTGRAVSANFFRVIGMPMTLGRGFLPEEEDLIGGQGVVVISHRLWKNRYGSDPETIGKNIILNREALRIVGVAPKDLQDATSGNPCRDLWVPFPVFAKLTHLDKAPMWREAMASRSIYPFLTIIGRLKPGGTLSQASAQMAIFVSNLKKAYPDSVKDWNPTLISIKQARWPEGNARFLSLLMIGAAICILFITCSNLANLLLARGSARQREIATRLALGASRTRIFRQLLTEGLVISGLAMIMGLAIYMLTVRLLPAFEDSVGTQLFLNPVIDRRVLFIEMLIALLATLSFSMAPAVIGSRAEIMGIIKGGGGLGGGIRKTRWRRILVASQIVLTATLLIAAGLYIKTASHFESTHSGFDKDVLILSSTLPSYGPDQRKMTRFYRQSLDSVRELPGVRSASWGEELPYNRRGSILERIQPEKSVYGDRKWLTVECNSVSSEYFKTLGIPILHGRDFTEQEGENTGWKVIINETLAHQFWPGANAIGKRIQLLKSSSPTEQRFESCEVIGVAKNAKYKAPWENNIPYLYMPFWRQFYYHMELHVSVKGDPRPYIDPILKLCKRIDSGVTLENPRRMSRQLESLLSQERSASFVLGIFGSIALLLAAIGLYGIISYSVAQRTHEFGIRAALGATTTRIARQVLSEGMTLALAGLAIGLFCSMVFSRYVRSRMHGLSPLDPSIYLGISVVILAVALFASLFPASAVKRNLIRALRND